MTTAAEGFEGWFAESAGDHGAPGWLRERRAAGMERFRALGFPTRKLEDWKYTNLAPVTEVSWRRGPTKAEGLTRETLEQRIVPVSACSLFVFVNGRFAPELSSPRALSSGVQVTSLAALLRDDPERLRPHLGATAMGDGHALSALNTALFEDGACVQLAPGEEPSGPIHLVFVSMPDATPTASHPRVLVVASAHSRAVVIEDHVAHGTGRSLANAVSEVVLEENASVHLVRLQREGAGCTQLSRTAVRQARDSRFAGHTLTLGGDLVRNDLDALLAEPGAECTLNGLFVAVDGEHVDNHTTVDHAMPHCRSRELYKGILAGRSRGVFHGRVIVRKDAQHTDAEQHNKNLLLSDRARIDTKPQLEIYADDVKCAHGSTIGRLDEDALFYLRTRGIEAQAARAMLTRAFAGQILDAVPVEPLRECVGELLAARFVAGREAA